MKTPQLSVHSAKPKEAKRKREPVDPSTPSTRIVEQQLLHLLSTRVFLPPSFLVRFFLFRVVRVSKGQLMRLRHLQDLSQSQSIRLEEAAEGVIPGREAVLGRRTRGGGRLRGPLAGPIHRFFGGHRGVWGVEL